MTCSRKAIILVISLLLLGMEESGCTLEPPIRMGGLCNVEGGGPERILSAEVDCSREEILNGTNASCAQFSESMELMRCPYGYLCNETSNVCSASVTCGIGQHISNGECEDDDLENCGFSGNKCSEIMAGWYSGVCKNAQCIATECRESYKLNEKTGLCEIETACEAGQHYHIDHCVEDTTAECGSMMVNCENLVGWGSGSCKNSKCVIESCLSGYELYTDEETHKSKCEAKEPCKDQRTHYDGDQRECISNELTSCGAPNVDCTKMNGWSTGRCIGGRCTAYECKEHFEIVGGTCQPITNSCVNGYMSMTDVFSLESVEAACIKDADDFKAMQEALSQGKNWPDDNNDPAYFVLTRDIDLGETTCSNVKIAGITFYGNGHTISGTIDAAGASNCGGLFSEDDGSYFVNVHSAVNIVHGVGQIGGFLGRSVYTTFEDCRASGTLTGTYEVGGLAGYMEDSEIINSSSAVTILGTNSGTRCGGLAGGATSVMVSDSSSSGVIQCGSDVGGFFGGISGDGDCEIVHSFSNAHIESLNESEADTGGMIGSLEGSAYIDSCYTQADIYGFDILGGFVGHIYEDGQFDISTSASLNRIHGAGSEVTQHAGGFVGLSEGGFYLDTFLSITDFYNASQAAEIFVGSTEESSFESGYVMGSFYNVDRYSSDFINTTDETDNDDSVCQDYFYYWQPDELESLECNVEDAGSIMLVDEAAMTETEASLGEGIGGSNWLYYRCVLTTGPAQNDPQPFKIPLPFVMALPENCSPTEVEFSEEEPDPDGPGGPGVPEDPDDPEEPTGPGMS